MLFLDDSYFSGNPPKNRENLVGTPEYYSPEQAAYIMDEEDRIEGKTLTQKSDIFTLGIIFCEYFTGEKPVLPASCGSTWICVSQRKPFLYSKKIPDEIKNIIERMLNRNPNERPKINDVFDSFREIKIPSRGTDIKLEKKAPIHRPEEGSELHGSIKIEEKKKSLRSKTWDVS